jgi:hypothetical protein
MSNLAFILNVMFAIYLLNFISSFLKSFTEERSLGVVFGIDLIFGIILLAGVVLVN